MKRSKLILIFTLLVVFAQLALTVIYSNIFIGLLGLSILIDSKIAGKIIKLIKEKQFWVLISPFIIFGFSALYSTNMARGWKELEIRLPLIIFPILYGVSPLTLKNRDLVFKFFILLTIVIPVIGFISQIVPYLETKDSGYFYNDGLVNYAGKKQAAYFALYVNIALVGVLYFWQAMKGKTKLQIGALLTAFTFLLIIQYLLASRMSMLVMLLLIVGFMIVQLFTKTSKKQIVVMFSGLVIAIIGLTVLFPKALKRFDSITHTEYQFDNTNPINHFNGEIKAENWNGLNTRLALWACAWEEVLKDPMMGTGIGDVQDNLAKNYQEKNFIFALKSNFNTHNQYLDILLSNGFVGLFLFLLFLGYIVLFAIKSNNWLLLGVVCVVVFSCGTENILSRNQGVVLVSLFLSMLVFNHKDEREKQMFN